MSMIEEKNINKNNKVNQIMNNYNVHINNELTINENKIIKIELSEHGLYLFNQVLKVLKYKNITEICKFYTNINNLYYKHNEDITTLICNLSDYYDINITNASDLKKIINNEFIKKDNNILARIKSIDYIPANIANYDFNKLLMLHSHLVLIEFDNDGLVIFNQVLKELGYSDILQICNFITKTEDKLQLYYKYNESIIQLLYNLVNYKSITVNSIAFTEL